jgi:hypothetical protein
MNSPTAAHSTREITTHCRSEHRHHDKVYARSNLESGGRYAFVSPRRNHREADTDPKCQQYKGDGRCGYPARNHRSPRNKTYFFLNCRYRNWCRHIRLRQGLNAEP